MKSHQRDISDSSSSESHSTISYSDSSSSSDGLYATKTFARNDTIIKQRFKDYWPAQKANIKSSMDSDSALPNKMTQVDVGTEMPLTVDASLNASYELTPTVKKNLFIEMGSRKSWPADKTLLLDEYNVSRNKSDVIDYSTKLRMTAATMFAVIGKQIKSKLADVSSYKPTKHVAFKLNEVESRPNNHGKSSDVACSARQSEASSEEDGCLLCEILNNEQKLSKRKQDLENFRETSMAECSKVLGKVQDANNIFRKYEKGNRCLSPKEADDKNKEGKLLKLRAKLLSTSMGEMKNECRGFSDAATVFCVTGPKRINAEKESEYLTSSWKKDNFHQRENKFTETGKSHAAGNINQANNFSKNKPFIAPGILRNIPKQKPILVPVSADLRCGNGSEQKVNVRYPKSIPSIQMQPVNIIHKNAQREPYTSGQKNDKRGFFKTFFGRIRRSLSVGDIDRKRRQRNKKDEFYQEFQLKQPDFNGNSILNTARKSKSGRSRSQDDMRKEFLYRGNDSSYFQQINITRGGQLTAHGTKSDVYACYQNVSVNERQQTADEYPLRSMSLTEHSINWRANRFPSHHEEKLGFYGNEFCDEDTTWIIPPLSVSVAKQTSARKIGLK